MSYPVPSHQPIVRYKPYDDCCPVAVTINVQNVQMALGSAGYTRPTLFCNPKNYGQADLVAEALKMNLEIDPNLQSCEWYVEFCGKKFGSIGI